VRVQAPPRLAAVLRQRRQAARAARGDTLEGGELIEEERSMPQFIKVATADELADQQAKLVCPGSS